MPLLWALAVLVFLGALVAAIWWLPSELTRHPSAGLSAAARLGAENAARGALVAALALVGAAALSARYTWRAAKATLAGQEIDRKRQEIDSRGEITDRYTKAIDQLGHDKTDVRIGGIYALERIARDSAIDHPAVIEVLAAFVREHSHEDWAPAGPMTDASGRRPTRPDVQSAVDVIGRRNASYDKRQIYLTGADLTGADLMNANLAGANLTRAKLTRANLVRANLNGADLNGADLTDANLTDANIGYADLNGVDLTRANPAFTLLAQSEEVPAGWARDPDSGLLRRANADVNDSGN